MIRLLVPALFMPMEGECINMDKFQLFIVFTVSLLVWRFITRWLPIFKSCVKLGIYTADLRKLKKQSDELVARYKESQDAYEKAMEVATDAEKVKLQVLQTLVAQATTDGLRLLVSQMEHLKAEVKEEHQFVEMLQNRKGWI